MKPAWSCLNDVTILDVSQLLPGPHACSLLRQLGAEVIKVEQPGSGDTARQLGAHVYAQFNRGKRSVALDLKSDAGRAAFLDLVRDADAVVEGFRPGVMARLGLGYDALAAVNPAIVLCSVSGFGQTGPYASHAGHDLNYLALAGYWATPVQVHDAVARPRVRVSDYAASGYAALSLAVAIMSARQHGQGQHLDVSIHDAVLSWTAHGAWTARAHEASPHASSTVMPENDLFETRDGRHLAMGILENKFWDNLCAALGDAFPALRDPRFATRAGRGGHKVEVNDLLAAVFRTRDLAAWGDFFAPLDIPFSPVLGAGELFEDAHVRAREVVRRVEGGIAVRFPVKFSLGLPDGDDFVAEVGQHNPR
ncbi:putative transferase; similar to caiB/baiF CoA-transferase family; Alpha-methylacyl-CoA racemase [Cupriavidus phytorum]|uniref:Crotonobetainyl-CoA:carnitine CoA-transferase CaiB-like acyl-CoA transferase n=2 Tax=Cupriavidus TaxID=106589 RepID=A0A2W7PDJ8_9BURK|nr:MULTISPECIES: CaiB/BaiF CoA-transferase family protein [Cupriavidus]PZX34311.1 crotonobetainyl-CoA:carnitine CoA-transferase CaiB-like acyl-CoA transferase [Cupriavidus alkaliphilus]SOY71750.1 putative transferase; similar to caiB/baiF CoA-transferase family; Alpha-methylacyl-CoA racemase [Cupriavidus taiwanensis]